MIQNMKQCHFCNNNVKDIDYKDDVTLKSFLDPHARILKHKRTSTCAKHQRKLAIAIKRARFMGLIPFFAS
jgi:small subunit ribosomal protein S18